MNALKNAKKLTCVGKWSKTAQVLWELFSQRLMSPVVHLWSKIDGSISNILSEIKKLWSLLKLSGTPCTHYAKWRFCEAFDSFSQFIAFQQGIMFEHNVSESFRKFVAVTHREIEAPRLNMGRPFDPRAVCFAVFLLFFQSCRFKKVWRRGVDCTSAEAIWFMEILNPLLIPFSAKNFPGV